jgi:hypothetical protein
MQVLYWGQQFGFYNSVQFYWQKEIVKKNFLYNLLRSNLKPIKIFFDDFSLSRIRQPRAISMCFIEEVNLFART